MSELRCSEVDAIRAAALLGICVVNVPFMALPVEAAFVVQDHTLDKLAVFLVAGFFQFKFFLLFSFIFGWGVGILQEVVHPAGSHFKNFYFKRLAALAMIGIAHAVLVFSGDILVLYAVLGVILWFIHDISSPKLVRLAILMVPMSLLCLSGLALVIDEMLAPSMSQWQVDSSHLAGGFFEASLGRLHEWPITLLFLFFLQGPLAMGAFVLGLVAYRTRFFQVESFGYRWLEARLPLFAGVAIPSNALYAGTLSGLLPSSAEWVDFIGFIAIGLGAPALSAIYLYFIILWARRFKISQLVLFAGRNSLSVYVLQGILCGVVFGGYGFGLFNELGFFNLFLVSLVMAFLSIFLVGCYVRVIGRAPLESLLKFILHKK